MASISVRNLLAVVSLSLAFNSHAVPVLVDFADAPVCDFYSGPGQVDELGTQGIFPADESIQAIDSPSPMVACPMTDTALPNVQVEITNLTGKTFGQVWYVSDPETSISNQDGWTNGEEAFRIDAVGANQPLIFESLHPDGRFEPGEIWIFVIDDYTNALGLPASAFGSVGLVGQNSAGDRASSGSIIATVVPLPATVWLFGSGLLGLISLARSRKA